MEINTIRIRTRLNVNTWSDTMNIRQAKKIVKMKGKLNYTEQQIRQAESIIRNM